MNSIHRPRRRCRVKSVNFKVLEWLLVREAVLAVAVRHDRTWSERTWRITFNTWETRRVLGYGAWLLAHHPLWRILP